MYYFFSDSLRAANFADFTKLYVDCETSLSNLLVYLPSDDTAIIGR